MTGCGPLPGAPYARPVQLHAALAAAATLVALAFCLSTLERWSRDRRPHQGVWTVSLAQFALGSACLWWGAGMGWEPLSFRLFFLFGAVLNVPYLALGTVYLLAGTRAGDVGTRAVTVVGAFCAGVILSVPLVAPLPAEGLPRGADVFGPAPRIMAAVASGVGATILLGGAVWSALRLLRGRHRPGAPTSTSPATLSPRRLAGANLAIAAGTLVLSAGGLLNSVLDEMDAFAVSLVVGVTLIFAGFLVAGGRRSSPTDSSGTAERAPRPLDARELDWLLERVWPDDGSAQLAAQDLPAEALR